MELELRNIVESIIFTAEHPVKVSFIMEVLNNAQKREQQEASGAKESEMDGEVDEKIPPLAKAKDLETLLDELVEKYQSDRYPFEVRKVAEGYQFFTKRAFYPYVKNASLNKNRKRLSRAALETLAIIAYRQPITKGEMEFIRGVNCDYAVQKLLDKKLVSIVGRAEAPGRPLLYACSPFFMEYFGIRDMNDLPKLKEFEELAEDHLEQFKQHQLKQEEAGEKDEATEEKDTLLEGNEEGSAGEEAQIDAEDQPAEPTEAEAETISEGDGPGKED
ncbi:MAG: SMC-Scp complex subunit ScpB [Bacteroidota bacterium]